MKFEVNGYDMIAKTSTFPGGEEYVSIKQEIPTVLDRVKITPNIRSSREIVQLMLLVEILRKAAHKGTSFILDLQYLPYARQDQVFEAHDSLSIKVFAKLINDMGFDQVLVSDCHSAVGLALLDNVVHISQRKLILESNLITNFVSSMDVIIAPDAGAAKKAANIANTFNKPVIQCLKQRLPGGTISLEVLGDIVGLKALVLDDICDGGGTFLALGAALGNKQPRELHLLVTHGIFSKGRGVLFPTYDTVSAIYDWTN